MQLRGLVILFLLIAFLHGCSEDSENNINGLPKNNSPVIREQSDTTITVGQTLQLRAYAEDEDGDSLSYGLIVYIGWHEPNHPKTQFNGSTGEFSFYAKQTDIPSRSFSFVANDNSGGTDTTTFNVNVYALLE